MSETLVPAAQYLRMSMDDQQNSIAFQQEAIRCYAVLHKFKVVATYADLGKSGLEIKHRPRLQQLIHEVIDGRANFKAIIVYDVSRWGRFPDSDESACYEFICRAAGVPIHYCAETFTNDITMPNLIMKALKRIMAAEYSRELGVKVVAAKRLVAARGFRLGGTPGYGFRRMLISADGRRKKMLQSRERKAIASDHVVLVPGPKHEVETIKTIFHLAAHRRNTPLRIAQLLNRKGVKFTEGKSWSENNIFRILKNEKYMGNLVWGQTHKLRVSSRENWIIKRNDMASLVSPVQFAKAQEAIQNRKNWPRKPDEILIKEMREVLGKEGMLTERLLQKHRYFGYRRYVDENGSIIRAHEILGYRTPDRVLRGLMRDKQLRKLRFRVLAELKRLFPNLLRIIRLPRQVKRQIIEVDNNVHISINVCRPAESTKSGAPRWMLIAQPKEKGLPSLICTPNEDLDGITAFYLVRSLGDLSARCTTIGEHHPLLAFGKRLKSLSDFYGAVREISDNSSQESSMTIRGDVVFNVKCSTVTVAGHDIYLPATAARVFKLLVNNAGSAVAKQILANEISGNSKDKFRSSRLMDKRIANHILVLRKRLAQFRSRIVELRGLGYTYNEAAESSPQRPFDVREIAKIAIASRGLHRTAHAENDNSNRLTS
jgi:DNA invertase Pin-like site-specific DNA recombinase/DNA-binding winged helix-turn-helix (wHTH) protein